MYDNRPIGFFDSGVGGLSILLEAKKLLPNENIIFLADQKNVSYGGKTKEQLIGFLEKAMNFFISQDVKAVVFACNTATVYTIEEMRKKFDIPIIGTVPVVKTLANITKTGKTAVFSTPATAESKYLKELIEKFCDGVEVARIGGSNLEELVERGNLNNPEIQEVLEKHLKPLLEESVDSIALGCTHYPFLREKIQKIVGPNVMVVDSGGAVARRLKQVLTNNDALSSEKGFEKYYTTGDKDKFERVASELTRRRIPAEYMNL
jgi:glutamate racemase